MLRLFVILFSCFLLAACDAAPKSVQSIIGSEPDPEPTPDDPGNSQLSCATQAAPYSAVLETTNLVTNGNFENATPSTGWTVEGTGGFDDDAGFEYEGENNAWVGNASGFSAVVQQVTVPAETCFRVSAQVRGNVFAGYIGYRFADDTLINEKKFVNSASYQEVFYDGYTDRVTELKIFVGLATGATDEFLQIDDIKLVERNCDDPAAFDVGATKPDALTLSEPEVIAKMTGPGSINKTEEKYDFKATDLGVMCAKEDSNTLAYFLGDTYGSTWLGWGGFGDPGADWRKNVLAFASNQNLSEGLLFDHAIVDADDKAVAVIPDSPATDDEISNIPTGCYYDGDALNLYVMAVTEWDPPGQPAGTWVVDTTSLFRSEDNGRTWTHKGRINPADTISATWETESNFKQISPLKMGEFVYLIATPQGRHVGGVYLGRVHKDYATFKTSTAYWDGSGWSYDPDDLTTLLPGKVGEPSLQYNKCTQRFVLSYFETDSAEILVRQSDQPMGPWSDPATLAAETDFSGWLIYGGFMVPNQANDEMHWMMSSWRDYNVYQIKNEIQSY